MDAFGLATKSKARLVARGDVQREFVDVADLYAPTVATSNVRLLAAFANEYDPCCVTLMYIRLLFVLTQSKRGFHQFAGRMW